MKFRKPAVRIAAICSRQKNTSDTKKKKQYERYVIEQYERYEEKQQYEQYVIEQYEQYVIEQYERYVIEQYEQYVIEQYERYVIEQYEQYVIEQYVIEQHVIEQYERGEKAIVLPGGPRPPKATYCRWIIHTYHNLPPSEIDGGLFLADFAGSGGIYLFHRIGWKGRIWQLCYLYGRAGARTATYITRCAAGETFGNQAGHNAQPSDSAFCLHRVGAKATNIALMGI